MVDQLPRSTKAALSAYSTCDISDALLKLQHLQGGFLPGLSMWSPGRHADSIKLVGPAYTVKFVRREQVDAPSLEKHYIDTIPSGAVICISAPKEIPHAVYGGLMSHRALFSGAVGTVVDGNFRDLDEQRRLGYTVFARNVATPSFYEVARASEVNVPVNLHDDFVKATIEPGDYIVGDLNGVVCIPKGMISQVIEQLSSIVRSDELVAADIDQGATFAEASKDHRKK